MSWEYQRIAYKGKGATGDSNTGGGLSSFTLNPPYPSGINRGDLLVIFEVHRTTNGVYRDGPSAPSGWSTATYSYGSGGRGTDPHYTEGHVFGRVYYKFATGAEVNPGPSLVYTGSPSAVLIDGAMSWMFCFSKPPDSDWGAVSFQTNADTTAGTDWQALWVSPSTVLPSTIRSDDMTVAFSGINSYTGTTPSPGVTTYSSEYILASSGGNLYGEELIGEAEGNMYTVPLGSGLKAVVTGHSEYGTRTGPGVPPWTYYMTASNYATNNQCGFTILMHLTKTTWPRKLKRYTGSHWNLSQMKRYTGSSFVNIDNSTGTGGLLKKYNGATWDPVSAMYLEPDTHVINATNAAQTQSFTLETGNFVRVLVKPGFSQTWVSIPDNPWFPNQKNFNGPSTVYLTLAENPAGSLARDASIYLTLDENGIYYTYDTVVVNQDAGPAIAMSWDITGAFLKWNSAGSPCSGTPTVIYITSNTAWEINVPSWLSVYPSSGPAGTSLPVNISTTGTYSYDYTQIQLRDSVFHVGYDYAWAEWDSIC